MSRQQRRRCIRAFVASLVEPILADGDEEVTDSNRSQHRLNPNSVDDFDEIVRRAQAIKEREPTDSDAYEWADQIVDVGSNGQVSGLAQGYSLLQQSSPNDHETDGDDTTVQRRGWS